MKKLSFILLLVVVFFSCNKKESNLELTKLESFNSKYRISNNIISLNQNESSIYISVENSATQDLEFYIEGEIYQKLNHPHAIEGSRKVLKKIIINKGEIKSQDSLYLNSGESVKELHLCKELHN